ncbi:MAG: hypothetical protein LBV43_11095 [Prevotella sp.]|jgi:hypothetical protein|nr:hypothetical protein [Prevotella sp.]
MKSKGKIYLDFVIDKLTNSIQNIVTGDSFPTEVTRFTLKDVKVTTKKNGWLFDWKKELNDNKRDVYKLTIINNPNVVQGAVSLSIESDHVFINLLENAPFNLGKSKMYEGVAGNLVAFACKLSFQHDLDGFVAFMSKTKLIEHYEKTLGAVHIGGQRMIIPTHSAKFLVEKYFKS